MLFAVPHKIVDVPAGGARGQRCFGVFLADRTPDCGVDGSVWLAVHSALLHFGQLLEEGFEVFRGGIAGKLNISRLL